MSYDAQALQHIESQLLWPLSPATASATAQQRTHVRARRAGIGVSAAQRFAREGFAVGLFSRSREKLEPVEQSIKKAGGRALSVPCDAGA